MEAHALGEELPVVGVNDLVEGVGITTHHRAAVRLGIHPVEVADVGVVAADQLGRLGEVGLIGVHGGLFLGLSLGKLSGQAGIAPHTCVTGVAAFVVLHQLEGLHALHGAGQEVGILIPDHGGRGGQQLAVSVDVEGDASPLHEVACLLQKTYVGREILHVQRRNIEFNVRVAVGQAVEADALVEALGADGDGLTRVGGVPAEFVQRLSLDEEVLTVAQIDGIVGGGRRQDGGDGQQGDSQDRQQAGELAYKFTFHGSLPPKWAHVK